LYRGFKNYKDGVENPVKSVFDTLQSACQRDVKIIVCGDFNIDQERDRNTIPGRLLESWSLENNLTQLISDNTRRRTVTRDRVVSLLESKIDHVWTNDQLNTDALHFPSRLSDHDFIWTKTKITWAKKTTKTFMRDYAKLTENNIIGMALEYDKPSTVDELEILHNNIFQCLAPLRVVKTRDPTQRESPEIAKLLKKRDRK